MQTPTDEQVRTAIESFRIEGELVGFEPLRRGHIHHTFVSRWRSPSGEGAFIHQRMNHEVFPDLDLLMDNIHTVSEHLVAKVSSNGADGFEPLRLVPTRNGWRFLQTDNGAWRTFVFIENTSSYDRCTSPTQAFEAARAFGWFQLQLRDLDTSALSETLPRFFSTPHRFAQFRNALERAEPGRVDRAREAIEFAFERADMVPMIEERLASGVIPPRIVHGDTKLNNILFDDSTGRAKGIVDLDTCMPGYSLYDFGDLVRFTAATSAEDATDLDTVGTDLELYRALADGYLSTAQDFLTDVEVELMPFSARLVTFTIGLRFLADYLSGDVYFATSRRNQNLDRARVQFGMVRFMEQHAASM